MKMKYLSYLYSTSVKCSDCRDGFYFNSTLMNCLKLSSDNNLVTTYILNFEYELDCQKVDLNVPEYLDFKKIYSDIYLRRTQLINIITYHILSINQLDFFVNITN